MLPCPQIENLKFGNTTDKALVGNSRSRLASLVASVHDSLLTRPRMELIPVGSVWLTSSRYIAGTKAHPPGAIHAENLGLYVQRRILDVPREQVSG